MLEQAQAGSVPPAIHLMEYAVVAAALPPTTSPVAAEPAPAELEIRILELERALDERTRSFEFALSTARAEAREAGSASERSQHTLLLASVAQSLTTALADFTTARDHYLAQVEQEVVRLALSIAGRILHREALMDPLLLAGAVRVALGQLAETTAVRLQVPASEHDMWSEMLRLMPNLPLHPEVIANSALATGDCLLETHLGNVDLGVRSQLAEIERGFFDLLEKRQPGSSAPASQKQPTAPEKRPSAAPASSDTAPIAELQAQPALNSQ